jgi:hypothetical protein
MDKNRTLAIAACGVLGVGTIGFSVHRYQAGVARAEATKKADNLYSAKKCITGHSPLPQKANAVFRDCELVKPDLLPEEIKPDFTQALAKNEAFKAVQGAKVKAKADKRRKFLAEQANNAAREKAAAETKFKAEGWYEEQDGIFVTHCSNIYCPGPTSNGYSKYTWRYMVWCKERACGDIYAKLNITQNGVVVGWTNDTAYGGYGQKVVLTFGSSTRGGGSIVEFIARGA